MEIRRVSRNLWGIFKQYHYLTSSIASNSECYVGFINEEPVAFVAFAKFPHPTNKNIFKIGRVVVVPHWQGYGIGMKMVEHIAEEYYKTNDVRITTTLPIVHSYLNKSKKWFLKFQGVRNSKQSGKTASISRVVRECYVETYQYNNDCCLESEVSRSGMPSDKANKTNDGKTLRVLQKGD